MAPPTSTQKIMGAPPPSPPLAANPLPSTRSSGALHRREGDSLPWLRAAPTALCCAPTQEKEPTPAEVGVGASVPCAWICARAGAETRFKSLGSSINHFGWSRKRLVIAHRSAYCTHNTSKITKKK